MSSLFPAASDTSLSMTTTRECLFPAASLNSDNEASGTSARPTLNWLENKSFPQASLAGTGHIETPSSSSESETRSGQSSDNNERYPEERSEDKNYKSKKRKKKEKKKHKKKKHKHKHEYREKHDHREKPAVDDKVFEVHGNKVFIEEVRGLESKDAFRIDRKADKYNWTYQSIYKGYIAKFHQGFQSCVGSGKDHSVWMKDKNRKVNNFNQLRYCSKDNRKVLKSVPLARIYPNISKRKEGQATSSNKTVKPESVIQGSSDFVFLSDQPAPWSHDRQVDIREKLLDEDTRMYLEGKSKPDDETEEISDEMFQQRNKIAEFNKRTREDPHNVKLWLEFVNFQDKILMEGIDRESKRKATRISLLEKKISIMKKAMEANPGCIELKLKYLELCQETLEPEEINKEMEDLLFVHPTNLLLWKHYLIFNQCLLSRFSVSRVSKLYHKCFVVLLRYSEGTVHTHEKTEKIPEGMMEVFCQYCNFLKQAGHKERGTALFQALIEFNLFCPEKLSELPLQDKVAVFESFWDSGVARVGKNGAKGWKFWMKNKDITPDPLQELPVVDDEKEQAVIRRKVPKWLTWLEIELQRDALHWLPWRPDLSKNETEDDCEDVDRLVLFDDISPALFTLPNHLNFELVVNFLSFLGVKDIREDLNDVMSQTGYDNLSDIFNFSDIEIGAQKYSQPEEIKVAFISRFLTQMILVFDGQLQTKLTKVLLHHQISQHRSQTDILKHLKKVGKQILKEPHNRKNMVIWSEYSIFLWKFGSQNGAREVIETALRMLSGNGCQGDEERHGMLILYRMLIQISLGFQSEGSGIDFKKQPSQVVSVNQKIPHVFVCLCENRHSDIRKIQEVGITTQLKCRRSLESAYQKCWNQIEKGEKTVDELDILLFIETMKCLALFEYCSSPSQLDSAVTVIDQAKAKVEKYAQLKNVAINQEHVQQSDRLIYSKNVWKLLEEIYKFKIYLLTQHMALQSLPLSQLREVVDSALELFPSKRDFLQNLMDMEERSHILRRLERFFSHAIDNTPSPVIFGYAVMSQIHRYTAMQCHSESGPVFEDSGMIHRMRSYLERGMEKDDTRHCPLLWRLYLHAEMKYGDRQRARGIFYRALQQCPWAKSLYLDGVLLFEEDKLDEIVDLMTEKELRIQIPVEEVDILMEDIGD